MACLKSTVPWTCEHRVIRNPDTKTEENLRGFWSKSRPLWQEWRNGGTAKEGTHARSRCSQVEQKGEPVSPETLSSPGLQHGAFITEASEPSLQMPSQASLFPTLLDPRSKAAPAPLVNKGSS